jgi:hypothetical protein
MGDYRGAAGDLEQALTIYRDLGVRASEQAHEMFQRIGAAQAPGVLAELNALTSPEPGEQAAAPSTRPDR